MILSGYKDWVNASWQGKNIGGTTVPEKWERNDSRWTLSMPRA